MSEPPPPGIDLPGLFENSADPIFAVNANRRIVFFNSACEQLTGTSSKDALGLECRFHGPLETGGLGWSPGFSRGAEPAKAGTPTLGGSLCPPVEALAGETVTTHALFIHPSGERLWRRIHYVPCLARDGSLSIVLGRIGMPEPSQAEGSETRPREALLRLRQRLFERYGFDQVVAASPAMQRVLDQVKLAQLSPLAGQNQTPVLFAGEKGVGKEHLARIVHYQGPRRQETFMALDCAALPPAALARHLHEAEAAGALYLREPAGLPRDLQAQLVERLARPGKGPRWLAGTSTDLLAACKAGSFLEPLYYRLSTLIIEVPPVRERDPDLSLLAQQVVERCNAAGDKQVLGVQPDALGFIQAYHWPGNLVEFNAVLRQAHEQARDKEIRLEDLPVRLRNAVELAAIPSALPPRPLPLDQLLETAERRLIELALRQTRGSKTKAAALLHVSRARLHRRMQLLGIADAEGEQPEEDDDSHKA